MNSMSLRRSLAALGITFAMALTAGCGGGGGGGDDGGDDDGNPPPPNSTAPTGHLWHDNYALDFLDGTQIASPTGQAPRRVTTDAAAWPWRDGSQYATYDYDVGDRVTAVTVSDTTTGDTVHQAEFDGYVRSLRPSPASKNVLLATWSEDSVSPAVYVFYDFSTQTVLDTFDVADASVDWLPDGRYLRITLDGDITIGTVGGTRQAAGHFAVPAGRQVNEVWVDPQGEQLLMQLWSDAGATGESDLWVAGIDGSAPGRLTETRITSYGKWSPDGRHVAFDVDTGLVCTGGGCIGQCGLWYVEATARSVTALPSVGDASKFRVKDSQGSTSVLGCELLGWTP